MPNYVKWYAEKGRENKCRRIRNAGRQRNYAKTALYEPKEWTLEEDELVLAHSMSDRELSKRIKRSVQSIQIRRCRLKKWLGE